LSSAARGRRAAKRTRSTRRWETEGRFRE
jgi:hypothetical protein